jgi:hypothetical protein
MSDQHPGSQTPSLPGGLPRRGLLAGLAALLTAALAKLTAQSAHALDNNPVVAGQITTSTLRTQITRTNPGVSDAGLAVVNTNGAGVNAEGTQFGVLGTAGGAGTGVGVRAVSPAGYGVLGSSDTGYGVYGTSQAGYGITGVDASSGVGVLGQTVSGVGVSGTTAGGWALYGEATGNGIGVRAQSAAGTGVLGIGPQAGRFVGNVLVEGNFVVMNGAKNAAVPHPDGSLRRLYCMEAPESVFEDFGDARLVNGRAEVRLDPDFDAVVHDDNYRVFLTPEGDCNGLYISSKGPHRFEVRELKGGTTNLAFTYRVVGKRRDIAAPRLERLERPAALPEVPARLRRAPAPRPEVLDVPQAPDRPGRPPR